MTVAVIDAFAAPTILYDVNRYSTDNGVPAFRHDQFKQIWAPGLVAEPATGDEQDWYGEETLDIEAVHRWRPALGSSSTRPTPIRTPTWTPPSTGSSTITSRRS